MRLGAPVFGDCSTPEGWVALHQAKGYTAAFCPVGDADSSETVRAYERAAAEAGIVIAEVGAWSNPMSRDPEVRRAAIRLCCARLALADEVGARCCVNIAGSLGEKWDGHHPHNLTEATFDLVVETVREIIDTVKPTRTYYTLETMPWMYPDSPESYARLIAAIDRDRFGVHLDPVNLLCSPQLYHANGALIRRCFELLGPHIRSCHAKDTLLDQRLTVHLEEARPGLGNLDFATYLRELDALEPDVPLLVEHLPTEEEYDLAVAHIRNVAAEVGVRMQ